MWIESKYLWFQITKLSHPTFSTFEIIFMLRIFENFVTSKVFTFWFCWSMPMRAPVVKICNPDDRVEDVKVAQSIRIWYCGHDGSTWVYPNVVFNIPPVFGSISTTIQIPKGGLILITGTRSGCLVGEDVGLLKSGFRPICCEILEWVRLTYQEFYRPSYFGWQQDLSRLCHTYHHIPSDTFLIQCDQWFCFW